MLLAGLCPFYVWRQLYQFCGVLWGPNMFMCMLSTVPGLEATLGFSSFASRSAGDMKIKSSPRALILFQWVGRQRWIQTEEGVYTQVCTKYQRLQNTLQLNWPISERHLSSWEETIKHCESWQSKKWFANPACPCHVLRLEQRSPSFSTECWWRQSGVRAHMSRHPALWHCMAMHLETSPFDGEGCAEFRKPGKELAGRQASQIWPVSYMSAGWHLQTKRFGEMDHLKAEQQP